VSARRSRAFIWLSVTFVLILLLAAAPLISAFVAGGIANALGCTLNEGGVSPCPFMGTDIGETLVVMFVLGWLAFVTLPWGLAALAIWLIAVGIIMFSRWRRRRRLA
jgi:hypothetical protein